MVELVGAEEISSMVGSGERRAMPMISDVVVTAAAETPRKKLREKRKGRKGKEVERGKPPMTIVMTEATRLKVKIAATSDKRGKKLTKDENTGNSDETEMTEGTRNSRVGKKIEGTARKVEAKEE